jgi:hypothetical protein
MKASLMSKQRIIQGKGKYILVLQADERLIDHTFLKGLCLIGDETYDIVCFPV